MSDDFFNKDEQEIIAIAVEQLSSVCDNAQVRDYMGFNRADASVGHHLASLPVDDWSETEYMYCWTILFKYRDQLEKTFGTTIENLYQNRLSELKEKTKNQRVQDLKSIKNLKRKDDNHIRKVLKEIGETLKDHVNGKDIIHYNINDNVFEITQNTKSHSESFLDAMSFISADREDGETHTSWSIKGEYNQALAYIIVKLIGKDKVHYTTNTLDEIKKPPKDKYEIDNLLSNGFDCRDTIEVVETEDSIDLIIKPRGAYGSFKKITRFYLQPDSFRAKASVVYMKDLRAIKTASTKKKYRIVKNGSDFGFFGLKNLFLRKKLPNPISKHQLNDRTFELTGETSILNIDRLSSLEGLKVINEDNKLTFIIERLSGLENISRSLKPYEIDIKFSDFHPDLLMTELEKKRLREKELGYKKIKEKKNRVTIDIRNMTAKIRFDYNRSYIEKIKAMVPQSERSFDSASSEWVIGSIDKRRPLLSYFKAQGFDWNEVGLNKP